MADLNLDNILGSVGDISRVLAEMERQRAAGRVTEAGVNQNQARAAADVYRSTLDAALKGPAMSAQQTALGDTLANVKPFSWTGETKQVGNIPVPQGTGGLTPANYGPATRQAGADLAKVAGARVTSPTFNLPTPPKIDAVPQASALDKFLAGAGGGGSLLGAAGGPGGGNLLDAAKGLVDAWRNHGKNPFGGDTTVQTGLPNYDPFSTNPETGMPYEPQGLATDPSGGTGLGPGMSGYVPPDKGAVDPSLATGYDPMAEFEAWLRRQNQDNSGGGGSDTWGINDWTDE